MALRARPSPGPWLGVLLAPWLALAPAHAAGIPAPGLAELEDMVQLLVPLVERTAGRPFTQVPEVVLADPAIMKDVLYAEQVHLLDTVLNRGDEGHREALAARSAASNAHAFAGKYGFLDKKLYVHSEGIALALLERGEHPRVVPRVTELVLAHELAHALQDQHVGLPGILAGRPGGDAVKAANCTMEGHAVWIHEQVGAALGSDDAVAIVADMLGYGVDSGPAAESRDRFYTSYVYGLGRDFMDHHAAEGGLAQTWVVLAEPPLTTAMILRPETYEPFPSGLEPRAVLAVGRARNALTRRSWTRVDEPVGDFDVRQWLVDSGGGGPVADAMVRGWTSRASADPMRGVEVHLLEFRTAERANQYVQRMKGHAKRVLEATTVEPFVFGSVTDYEAIPVDRGARESIQLHLFDTPPQDWSTVWVSRERWVVQVVMVNVRPRERVLARAIERALAGVEVVD